MAAKTITIDLVEIMTLEGHPTPTSGNTPQGDLWVEYTCDTPDAAVKTAKAAVRELVKYRQDKNVTGERHGNKILFGFTRGGELPQTWRGRAGHAHNGSKPEILADLQTALKPYAKANYFNSSVNEGLVVEDVPVGLQFEADGEEIVAKLLKSKKGEWTAIPVDGHEQAIALVQKLQKIGEGL